MGAARSHAPHARISGRGTRRARAGGRRRDQRAGCAGGVRSRVRRHRRFSGARRAARALGGRRGGRGGKRFAATRARRSPAADRHRGRTAAVSPASDAGALEDVAWHRSRPCAGGRPHRRDRDRPRRPCDAVSQSAVAGRPELHRAGACYALTVVTAALVLCAAYLIGSIPFALVLARRWGTGDLRHVGSGNLGAANVMRASGVTAGVLVAILDIAKGALSVMLAARFSSNTAAPAAAGLAAIVGHIYPVWLRFRGGKGVATACGAFSVLTPLAIPPAIAIFLVTVTTTKYISLGSLLATIALPPLAYALGSEAAVVIAASMAAAIIVFRHRSNLARLRSGTERRLGARA